MECIYCCGRIKVLEVRGDWKTVQCLNVACYVRYNERVVKEENRVEK